MKALAITLAIALTITLSAIGGAYAYHTYLLANPQASTPYVTNAMEHAQREADKVEATEHALVIAGRIRFLTADYPNMRLPEDCTGDQYFGLNIPRSERVTECTVTRGADGKVIITASTPTGMSATLSPR